MKNRLSKGFLAVIIVVLGSSACNALGGSTIVEDDFEGSSIEWGTGTDDTSSIEYADGGLRMQVFEDNYIVWSTPDVESFDQGVHIEVTIKNNDSDKFTAFGIICNLQEFTDAFYYFAISPNGDYVIADKSLALDTIILTNDGEWKESDLIPSDAESYRLGVDCGNGILTMYVDGQQVDSVSDSSYTSGSVGLVILSAEDVRTVDATFDDFVVTKLP